MEEGRFSLYRCVWLSVERYQTGLGEHSVTGQFILIHLASILSI